MSASTSMFALLVALFLPWLSGSIWAHYLLRTTGRSNVFMVLGQGYFLGVFATTLMIRLWDLLGFGLSFPAVAALLAACAVLGLVLCWLRPGTAVVRAKSPAVPRWQLAVATLLLGLIAWRHLGMLQELLLRPLFAWDAWMNWAPKAIVWFHQGELVDFVSESAWLRSDDASVYTLGNKKASLYPLTVPLIQLWGMLAVGAWDSSAVYLPWIMAPVCLGLALYGHLRLAGAAFLPAVTAVYLLLSMPYLNVHSVLAGYADIWLAAAFGLGVFLLYEWRHSRHWAHGLLLLGLVLLCVNLKNPGIVLGLILLIFAVRGYFRLSVRGELALLAGGLLLLLLVSAIGVNVHVPGLGRLALDGGTIAAGKLGRFQLAYHDVGHAFTQTLFVMINWHLLWYLVPLFALYGLYQRRRLSMPGVESLAVLAALAFVVFVFVFTKHYEAAVNFVTLNRALLYPVPALIFCLFLAMRDRKAIAAQGS